MSICQKLGLLSLLIQFKTYYGEQIAPLQQIQCHFTIFIYSFWFLETRFLYIALAIPELTM